MKQKKFGKKLTLNKMTISHLDAGKMKRVNGGDPESMFCWPTGEPGTVCCETYRCPNPTNTCQCPGETERVPYCPDTYNSCIYC